jgi:hypothetical protein
MCNESWHRRPDAPRGINYRPRHAAPSQTGGLTVVNGRGRSATNEEIDNVVEALRHTWYQMPELQLGRLIAEAAELANGQGTIRNADISDVALVAGFGRLAGEAIIRNAEEETP